MLARSVQYDEDDLKDGNHTESENEEEEKNQIVQPNVPQVEPSSLLQQI